MIVAGFGFRGAATRDSLLDAYRAAAGAQVADCIATASDKAGTAAFRGLAAELDLPVRAVAAADLHRQPVTTQAAASLAARGTGSLAEAAALAAAGPNARLLCPRVISDDKMATCALALGETT